MSMLDTLNLFFRELGNKTCAVGNGLSTMNDAISWMESEHQVKLRNLAGCCRPADAITNGRCLCGLFKGSTR